MNNHPRRYTAVCQSVTPNEARAELKKIDSCYLGVSLQTPAFEPPMLSAVTDWISSKFPKCTVAIGDSIHRHTLQILGTISPEDAMTEAVRLGEAFVQQNLGLFSAYKSCKFEFVKFSDIQRTTEYKDYEVAIKKLFESDLGFRRAIETSAQSFISRQIKRFRIYDGDHDRMVDLSCRYITEEIACFTWLAKNGRRVDVYPGSELPVLIDVARGKYAVPPPLRRRINIALKLTNN